MPLQPNYASIRPGSLLRADGGYLILNVHDLLAEPGAWRSLTRTLRSGQLEIVPPEMLWFRPQTLLHPEPIPINVRVILIGDPWTYYRLDALDPDFGDLFKTLADFDDEIERDDDGIQHYTSVIAHICRSEELLPFHSSAVAALIEHGARIASRRQKLTARFGRIADLTREASFLAQEQEAGLVRDEHVKSAVSRWEGGPRSGPVRRPEAGARRPNGRPRKETDPEARTREGARRRGHAQLDSAQLDSAHFESARFDSARFDSAGAGYLTSPRA